MATKRSSHAALGGPLHRPVNRLELAGSIIFTAMLVTFLLRVIFPLPESSATDKMQEFQTRLGIVEQKMMAVDAATELVRRNTQVLDDFRSGRNADAEATKKSRK